jgi:hypothetical protein
MMKRTIDIEEQEPKENKGIEEPKLSPITQELGVDIHHETKETLCETQELGQGTLEKGLNFLLATYSNEYDL